MHIGDLNTGTARLHLAFKTLRLKWEETKAHWHDRTRMQFEEDYLDQVEPTVTSTLEAIGRMTEMLGRAQRDCSENSELGF